MEPSIRERVFYAIRLQDVELAECFAARCPDVADVVELNTFFHHLLAQYNFSTTQLRSYLDDTMGVDKWLRYFNQDILPVLRQQRLPEVTTTQPISPYAVAVAG